MSKPKCCKWGLSPPDLWQILDKVMKEKPADLLKHAGQERAEASTIREIAKAADDGRERAQLLLTAQSLEQDAARLETEAVAALAELTTTRRPG